VPGEIIADVLAGIDEQAIAIENRKNAIEHAIREAGSMDVILIAGKGHEDYQLVGAERLDFSDYEVARASIEARLKAEGGQ
jgi:UDP-N-acetylmuramoyl-L-alanyl-D-glutamate--2,6-diaminopimelate ligase